jgi:hypothetical protein
MGGALGLDKRQFFFIDTSEGFVAWLANQHLWSLVLVLIIPEPRF